MAGLLVAGGARAADTPGSTAPARARTAKPDVTNRVVTAPFEVAKPGGQRPLFQLFGLPVVVYSPVAPPYSGAAYNELGGQPESGRDAVMAQSMHEQ